MADSRNKTYETSEIRVRVFWEQSESFHTQASLSMLKSSVSSEGHAILSTGRQVRRKVVRGSPCNCGLHSEVEGYILGTSNAILLATTSNSLLLQVAQTTLCRIGKKWKDAVMARRHYTDICRRVWQKPRYPCQNPLALCISRMWGWNAMTSFQRTCISG
jgi:hypothetical protein